MAAHSQEHGIAGRKTIFVRNLPYSTTNESLEKVFSDIGPVKQCFVVSDQESGKCRGFGYIKFTLLEDAEKALSTVKKVNGRPVHLMFANKKEKKKQFGQPKKSPKTQSQEDIIKEEDLEDLKPEVTEIKEEPAVGSKDRKRKSDSTIKTGTAAKKTKEEKIKKETTAHTEGKRARLIVRNLSFKCSEKDLKEAFSKYGTIVDVHIPTKEGGLKRGFGFVQFSNKAEAGMAVKAQNGKKVMDRKVAVDFTLPKEKYEQKIADKSTSEPSPDNEDEAMDKDEKDFDIKEEDEAEEEAGDEDDDEEEEDDDEEEEDDDEEEEDDEAEEESESAASENSEESENEDKENDDDSDNDEDIPAQSERKFERPPDVGQGRTIFIRNVPYNIEEEAIEEYFSKFGHVRYARNVVDHTTGMSKGTAFVQFASKESADLCLKGADQPGQHQLGGRDLLCSLAVDRNTAQGLKQDKKKLPKDTRNLYLAREGMIRPGTEAARDVTPGDLSKRLRNDALKRRKLKDQNTFISSTRLCFHNIPATVNDKELREVILKHTDCKKFKLVEAKIMRDLNRVNSEGKAKSRGYGFISFTTHEVALSALNSLNNNAAIFGPNKRPIVEFSIENRKALQTKEKRMEKSKMRLNQEKEKEAMQGKKGKRHKEKKKATSTTVDRSGQDKVARTMHSGPLGLPRHSGPKQRHKPRPSAAQGKAKKPKGFIHPAKAQAQVRRQREPRVKQETSRRKKGRADTDSFDKLVAAHKKKIISSGLSF